VTPERDGLLAIEEAAADGVVAVERLVAITY
jgi:hypothetical protein